MWSMDDYRFLKPACSWRSSLSTAVVMRWRMMQQKILMLMDSSVMTLQLLHSDRFPFLVIDDCTPLPSVRHHFIVQHALEDALKKL